MAVINNFSAVGDASILGFLRFLCNSGSFLMFIRFCLKVAVPAWHRGGFDKI